jgi:nicotinamidase-related amidase
MVRGEASVELDPRLGRRQGEVLIEKQRASAFWGTAFGAHLVRHHVDTLIITGCSTSGCIRATAESAHNENYHTIVVADAVGDRHALAHECNLTDIDLRYGDVVTSDQVARYLQSRTATVENARSL